MASNYTISTIFAAVDRMKPVIQGMKASVLDYAGTLKRAKSEASNGLFGAVLGGNLAYQGVTMVANAIKDAWVNGLKLASDLTEVQNVVDTTFGPQASRVINKWSRDAISAFGLSELQAKSFTGTMGAMLKSSGLSGDKIVQMSKGLAGLAGDFASFYNLDPEEAFMKIRSGISGEIEPLKQLGINMSQANLDAFALTQGIRKKVSAMTQAEQATLRYAYLMKVSADAQGDFAKTLETSYANQKRVADTQFAQQTARAMRLILPYALQFQKTWNAALTAFGDWLEKNGPAVAGFIDFLLKVAPAVLAGVAAIWLMNGAVKLFAVTTKVVSAGIVLFNTAMAAFQLATEAGTGVMGAFNLMMSANPVGVVIVALGILIGLIALVAMNWESWGPTILGVLDTIKKGILSLVAVAFSPLLIAMDAVMSGLIALGKLAGMDMTGLENFQAGARKFVVENTFAGDIGRALAPPAPAAKSAAAQAPSNVTAFQPQPYMVQSGQQAKATTGPVAAKVTPLPVQPYMVQSAQQAQAAVPPEVKVAIRETAKAEAIGAREAVSAPISPNAGLISRQETISRTESKAKVEVDIKGLPAGSTVKQSGASTEVTTNLGPAKKVS